MATRFLMTAGRILLTKPGYDAHDGGLSDRDKLFDSNWNFSGVLIAAGTMTDPAPVNGNDGLTSTSSPLVIAFPSPGYVPTAYVTFEYQGASTPYDGAGFGELRIETSAVEDGSRVYADRLELSRPSISGGGYRRYRGLIHYRVFGV